MGKCCSSTTLLLSSLQAESDEAIDLSQKAEEEGLPVYKPNEYYPTRIGLVINDRGQVVSKLASARGMLYFAPILIDQIAFNTELMIWKLQGNDDLAGAIAAALGRENLCLLLTSLVDTIEHSRSMFFLLSQKGKEVEQDFPPGRQF
jgi:hypothetical protein